MHFHKYNECDWNDLTIAHKFIFHAFDLNEPVLYKLAYHSLFSSNKCGHVFICMQGVKQYF